MLFGAFVERTVKTGLMRVATTPLQNYVAWDHRSESNLVHHKAYCLCVSCKMAYSIHLGGAGQFPVCVMRPNECDVLPLCLVGVLWQGAVLYDPPPRLLVDAGRELQLLAL